MKVAQRGAMRGLLCLVTIAGFTLSAAGQQTLKYSVDVKVVNVLATVRDKHGKIVNDLAKDDFVLEEDGRPQAIRYFTRDSDLPLTLGLLVDTSMSQRLVLDQERSASGKFVDEMVRENKDSVFLIHFDREVELLQDLTSSREKLDKGLSSLRASQPDRQDQNDDDQSGRRDPGQGGRYPGSGRGGAGGHRMHAGTLLYGRHRQSPEQYALFRRSGV